MGTIHIIGGIFLHTERLGDELIGFVEVSIGIEQVIGSFIVVASGGFRRNFVGNILEDSLIKKCCKGCKDYVMTAIIFTFYTKSGTYKEILVEKGTKKYIKK